MKIDPVREQSEFGSDPEGSVISPQLAKPVYPVYGIGNEPEQIVKANDPLERRKIACQPPVALGDAGSPNSSLVSVALASMVACESRVSNS